MSQQEKINISIKFKEYDSSIYPPLEGVPYKLAIIKRNEWMIDKADLIVAYVNTEYGGARRALTYARRRNKSIINLVN